MSGSDVKCPHEPALMWIVPCQPKLEYGDPADLAHILKYQPARPINTWVVPVPAYVDLAYIAIFKLSSIEK